MAEEVRILVVKPEPLKGEKDTLQKAFEGKNLAFEITDPKDHIEHLARCREMRPAFVLLPLGFNKSIPTQAMEEGYPHIVICSWDVKRVCSLQPVLEPLEV